MAGRSEASNLTGMLTNLSNSVGKMGDTGNQYVDTFRRQMAPEADMNDSASLLNYADWARRNGYDEEAKQYMVLGATQKKAEEKKAFATSNAKDIEKLRSLTNARSNLSGTIKSYRETDARDSNAGPMPNPVLESQLQNATLALNTLEEQRSRLIQGMNDRGDGSFYGIGNEGSVAERALATESLAAYDAQVEREENQISLLEARADWAESIESASPRTLQDFQAMGLTKRDHDQYMADFNLQLSQIDATVGRSSAAGAGKLAGWNKTQVEKYTTLGSRRHQQREVQSKALANEAYVSLVQELDTEKGMGFFGRLTTDQADALAWMRNNTDITEKVLETASLKVIGMRNYEEMTDAQKMLEIKKEFVKMLSATSSEFQEEFREDTEARLADEAEAEAGATINDMDTGLTTQDYSDFMDRQAQAYFSAIGDPDAASKTGEDLRKTNTQHWTAVRSKWTTEFGSPTSPKPPPPRW